MFRADVYIYDTDSCAWRREVIYHGSNVHVLDTACRDDNVCHCLVFVTGNKSIYSGKRSCQLTLPTLRTKTSQRYHIVSDGRTHALRVEYF